MSSIIGIRHEDKYKMERRTPLTPNHIEKLIKQHNLEFIIQSSPKRIFSDLEFKNAGAQVEPDLKKCDVIFGVKEISESSFEKGKTYIFFSHVIKGQPYNMPMLKKMMEMGCNLIDYEVIKDDQNKRLIFFGKYAGLAGMINSLWSVGQRLKESGYTDNPFVNLKQSFQYTSLAEAKAHISEAGMAIASKGLPKALQPFTIGFTGYGNVSIGAQEIANLLPSIEITPEQLLTLKDDKNLPSNVIFKVVFKEENISKLTNNGSSSFDLQDYYRYPEKYENNFEQYIPHLSVLMNCMYWDKRYPRIFTKEYARQLYSDFKPKIMVIGDITCDPDGSIEFTHKGTEIEDPVFVYNPMTDKPSMGFKGEGILVMAVDILPSELPKDSSIAFADALNNFVEPIANADFSEPFSELKLPYQIKKALILKNGKLTPSYEYISEYL
jgi:saccharopine dehydrogenase (NAD+, L-lysine forming)